MSQQVPAAPSATRPRGRLGPELLALLLFLALLAAAAGLRLARLDNRLMHCDEAVGAAKFGLLLEEGEYEYDPHEFHGPSLNYLTLPVAWIAGAEKLADFTETRLRLLPAVFGILLVALVWLARDELGRTAALFAAALAAVSPAMVFYSRYYIHEMLLVFCTFAAIVALWRYVREASESGERPRWSSFRRVVWLVLLGISLGMMHATKETCVIPMFAMAVAAVTMPDLRRIGLGRLALDGLLALSVAVGVSALFFSSFFTHPGGVVDSLTAYAHYFTRAGGEGSVGPQAQPWYYYFRVLFWWREPGGPLWSEGAIAALALVGLVAAVWGRGFGVEGKQAASTTGRFLAVYAVLVTLIYSAISYKTPWSALGMLHGTILLAGVGAAVLVRLAPGYVLKGLTVSVLLAAVGHLGWQAHRASFADCNDRTNPYVHTPTSPEAVELADRIRQFADADPQGCSVPVHLICRDKDYWPLPWYLRDFDHLGGLSKMPSGRPAPIIVTQPELEGALAQYLYDTQPEGERPLYVPVPRDDDTPWHLRRNVPLSLFVRLDLWQASQSASPEPADAQP